jgi:hypothetical protein
VFFFRLHHPSWEQVGGEQFDCCRAVILPPMCRLAGFDGNIASFVNDWNRAIACVFGRFAFNNVDNRRSVAVAMPGYYSARLNNQFAQSEQTTVDLCRLLGYVDRANHRVGDAFAGVVTGLVASVATLLAGHSPAPATVEIAIVEAAAKPTIIRRLRTARRL